jgi:hypothetical protein
MTTSDGEIKSLVKIIRNESIGSHVWNSSLTNDWTTSSLNTYLNGDWYISNLNDYENLIESVVWKLGGWTTAEITTTDFYTYERGTKIYNERPTTWNGKIGLMYISDYGFATSGGSSTDRKTCLATKMNIWNSTDPDVSDCKNNDFLFIKTYESTITPSSGSDKTAYTVNNSGNIYINDVKYANATRPVSYLKSNTQILSGSGTSDDPWIIGIE